MPISTVPPAVVYTDSVVAAVIKAAHPCIPCRAPAEMQRGVCLWIVSYCASMKYVCMQGVLYVRMCKLQSRLCVLRMVCTWCLFLQAVTC